MSYANILNWTLLFLRIKEQTGKKSPELSLKYFIKKKLFDLNKTFQLKKYRCFSKIIVGRILFFTLTIQENLNNIILYTVLYDSRLNIKSTKKLPATGK